MIGEKKVPGVIGLKAIHLTTKEERKKAPRTEALYIDIGCKDKASAGKLAEPGDYGAFVCQPEEFGDGLFKARAIDDRVGCAVMLKLLEEELPLDVAFAFTAQEEVGTRGAFGAAFAVTPEVALVLETTTAANLPGVEGHRRVCSPGRGPVISYMDGGTSTTGNFLRCFGVYRRRTASPGRPRSISPEATMPAPSSAPRRG